MRRDWQWQQRDWRWRYRRRPPPFVRWMGCAFVAMMLTGIIGATAIVSLIFRAPEQAAVIIVLAAAVIIALITSFFVVLRRVRRFYREQDRLRRQLMADVAHELRTPLAILQGRVEGLIDGVYPRDDAHLAQLLDETKHLARLVEDVGTIANAEAGALELRIETIDPAELIRDAARAFDRPIAIDIPEPLPMIRADPIRIREVLLNLLSNAARHTPPGGEIAIHAVADSGHLLIRVADTGAGISTDDLPHVFDRFRKGEGSHGSGLGLAIARTLVQAHGGDIRVESEVGRGTTVTVMLPSS